jgi:ammonium transporter, Amt family
MDPNHYLSKTKKTIMKYTGKIKALLTMLLIVGGSLSLSAQQVISSGAKTPVISAGNTAWVLMATVLVLLMTIPGLAFFYGGLVRQKNILNILMQCFIATALITVQWVAFGYSLSFGSSHGILAPFIGGFDWAFLKGISINEISPYYISQPIERIPHFVFILYQCMFAVITPALIIGAFAERIKFSGFLLFSLLWATFVYDPIAHWIWSTDGWLYKLGAVDFAGGAVVHINAGIAALVMALMIGRRKNYMDSAIPPHNIPFVALGAGLLWVGWFGFNAGSGLAADGLAANAFMVTHVSAAVAASVWMFLDWIFNKRPTIIGIVTASVAGLAAITPAAGFVNVGGAVVIGAVVSLICFYMVGVAKSKFGYDDSLDAFGVHGIAGLWGTIAVGLFASPVIQNYAGLFNGGGAALLWKQLLASGVTIVYSGIVTFVLFKVVDKLVGIRVTSKDEAVGLDFTMHKEIAYTNID